MSETKERRPDSTMNEQAKQQLREIIDYKKKDMVDIYIERHKPKYDLLVEKGLI